MVNAAILSRNLITDKINIQFLLLSVYVAWSSELFKSSEGTYILQVSKCVRPRINTKFNKKCSISGRDVTYQ